MVILVMGVSWIRWRLVLLVIPGALLFQRVTGDIDEATTRNIEADFDGIFRDIIRKAAPLASEVAGSPELSGPCSASLLKFFLHLRLKEPWALRSKFKLSFRFDAGVNIASVSLLTIRRITKIKY